MTERQQSHRSGFFNTEAGVVWVIWLTYGSFYFCRTNISAAVPGIQAELGLDKGQIGIILGSLKIAYGIGQLINGQLAERFPPRRLLAIGMLGSALLNVVFGFGTALYFLIFIWACNGYSQALGWTPCMRVAANWFAATKRGKAVGLIGTGYQTTAALTFVISGACAEWIGWRAALYIPATLLVASSIHMWFFLQESPPAQGADMHPSIPHSSNARPKQGSFWDNVALTISNPALWLLGLSLGLLNACRYGFLDWGLTHLVEVQGTGIGKAGFKMFVLPIGGIAGAFLAGWATDRFFGGRRAPVICGLLLSLGVLTLIYNNVVETGLWISVVILLFIGFAIYGPQVLLVGTAPIDLAKKGTAAAAVGFVNFMGYMGAFSGDYVTGRLVDDYSWRTALFFWAGCAFAAAGATALLWNANDSTRSK